MHKTPTTMVTLAAIGLLCLGGAAPNTASTSTYPMSQNGPPTYEGFTEPVKQIEVSASQSGRVASVLARRGDIVAKGDMLMLLDTQVLEASRRVAQSKANASARQQALKIEHDIKQDRYEKLFKLQQDGAGSPEEVKRAEADANIAKLNWEAAKEDTELKELELAEIEARIEQRRARSPIDGVVTDVIKETGEYVSLSEPHVATVVQLENLRVTFFVSTEVAARLSVQQKVNLTLPGNDSGPFGQIEHIGAVTEADSGRVRVDVLIANPDRQYRSGVRCLLTLP